MGKMSQIHAMYNDEEYSIERIASIMNVLPYTIGKLVLSTPRGRELINQMNSEDWSIHAIAQEFYVTTLDIKVVLYGEEEE